MLKMIIFLDVQFFFLSFFSRSVTWHKPFCIDLSSMTFDMLRKLLQTVHKDNNENNESKDLLKHILKILSTHFGLLSSGPPIQSPLIPEISPDDKKALESLLYELVDSPSCPQDIMRALSNCLYEGMNLLLPPLRQRLVLANQLLKLDVNSIKKSQKINLRLIMQSINDPKIMGILMQESCQDHEG